MCVCVLVLKEGEKEPSLGFSCNATVTDCLLHVGQGGFVEWGWVGGLTRKSEVEGECWGRRGGLSPSHTLCLLAICWGFIMVVSVRVRRGGAAFVELDEGGLHSVTSQPSTLQSHAGPGQGRPGHRRLQTLSHTGREIYSPADPT